MIRISVIALALVFVVATSAFAQGRPASSTASPSTNSSPAASSIFSKASIVSAVSKTIGTTTVVPRANKSFWKTPWPYIIAVAAVALVFAFAGGTNSTYGGGIS